MAIRRLITNSSGTKTALEILDEQPRIKRACISEHSLLAYSKQVFRCNFYPKYRPILIRELYMHALNITSRQDLVCLPIYTEKGNMQCVLKFTVNYSFLFYPPKNLGRYLALSIR